MAASKNWLTDFTSSDCPAVKVEVRLQSMVSTMFVLLCFVLDKPSIFFAGFDPPLQREAKSLGDEVLGMEVHHNFWHGMVFCGLPVVSVVNCSGSRSGTRIFLEA